MNSDIFVSVIIPVRNRTEKLRKCLDALMVQTYAKENLEIIVVDNDSSEAIASVCELYPGVTCVFEGGEGSYLARNTGIEKSRGEIIAFTDSDCVPARTWIQHGVEDLLDLKCDLIGGKIEYSTGAKHLNIHEVFEQNVIRLDRQEVFVKKGYVATANAFAFRRVFDEAGPFDGRLKSLGDIEWALRVTARGFKLKYSDKAVVYHPRRSTYRDISMKLRRVGGREQLKIREGRYLAAFFGIMIDAPFSPKVLICSLFCPGVRASQRLPFILTVYGHSFSATIQRLRVLMGRPVFRGD